jgi:hypothetical protein
VEWAREYLLTTGTRTRVPVGEKSLASTTA